MPSIILSNIVVTVSLIILISISFSLSYAELLNYYSYLDQDVLIKDLVKINNAINYIYGKIQTSINIELILTPGSRIDFYLNGTIMFYPSVDSRTLKSFILDPNNLIVNIGSNFIYYKVTFSGERVVATQMSHISLLYSKPNEIEVFLSN
jgi:hypothetical protein